MKMIRFNKMLSLILCFVLITASTFVFSGCSDNLQNSKEPTGIELVEVGEGKNTFTIQVEGEGDNVKTFRIHTDKQIVGEALLEHGIIAGEEGPYGLYVKTVNGETHDYNEDKKYWAFYIDDKYAVTGVDTTEIDEEAMYSFRIEK